MMSAPACADTASEQASPATVVASLPYWYLDAGTDVVLANRPAVTEVSPWLYGLASDGTIVPQYPDSQAGAVTADLDKLRQAGLAVVPSIANVTNGSFSYQPIADMLHDADRTKKHIADIVALANNNGFAGIDIDYEDLAAGDRAAFTSFTYQLGQALHAAKLQFKHPFSESTLFFEAPLPEDMQNLIAALGAPEDASLPIASR